MKKEVLMQKSLNRYDPLAHGMGIAFGRHDSDCDWDWDLCTALWFEGVI